MENKHSRKRMIAGILSIIVSALAIAGVSGVADFLWLCATGIWICIIIGVFAGAYDDYVRPATMHGRVFGFSCRAFVVGTLVLTGSHVTAFILMVATLLSYAAVENALERKQSRAPECI